MGMPLPKSFGEGHQIGDHPFRLISPQGSAAAHSPLDLVIDPERTGPVAEIPDAGGEPARADPQSVLALNDLGDHRCRTRPDGDLQRAQIAKGKMAKTGG